MGIEATRELDRVTVDVRNKALAIIHAYVVTIDGVEQARAEDVEVLPFGKPKFEVDGGRLRMGGHFPVGSHLHVSFGTQDVTIDLIESFEHWELPARIAGAIGDLFSYELGSVDVDDTFETLMRFQLRDAPESVPRNTPVKDVAGTHIPPVPIPDEIKTALLELIG